MASSTAADLQRRLDDLLEHLPAGVVVHDVDGRILHANRLACELIGRSLAQLRGTRSDGKAWQLFCADGSPMQAKQFPVNAVLRTGRQLSQQVLGIRDTEADPVRWLICNAYPERDEQGVLRRVVVCFTDCTALKEAEQSLQKSEERLRLVLLGSTDAYWDYDLVENKIHYSQRWWTMLGYQPGELGCHTDLWLELMHPEDRPELLRFWKDLLEGDRETYSVEWRLRHHDGHYVPVLSRCFVTRDARGRALRVSGTNTDLTERKQAEQRIYELANFDHLTGLPNRRLLVEELDKALARSQRSGCFGAVIFLDLDNFKLLNDTMGHDFGDMLLRQVAERLRHTVRHCDQLARLGGDEFVLVLEDLAEESQEAVSEAQHVVEKLQSSLAQPYYLDGRLFLSTPSMGVALFDGGATDLDTILKQADLAMYRAKSEGRNTARFFDPGMQASAEHQVALEHALREGLSAHEFVLYCQPQFSSAGRLVGAEVLVRWRRADGALLVPNDFIGVAESSGLIVPLGQYVLDESCRALARWRADRTLGQLELAVNISAHQLHSADFTGRVAGALLDTGAPPDKLCLELTESVLAHNVAEVIERMRTLCKQGVHFSLDDFGTGYSSLAYLKRFPLSALKIDRSFVHDVHLDPDAAPIVEAIIALARKLKLDIVAEGVEHEAQRSFLVGGGCGTLQGYLLGRPVPIWEFERTYSNAGIGHA
ncbi:bifunctional diguanylate cyclase/phosphodiesterase [Massilia sp. LC238]|uniref:putative bifunctional diguanylate cyclase/phosphodiesterase n=1 Tax=Massilia sp. LC238 TaxID=1502852 RepID=UPI0004E2C790|nr:bifunctional diguanylate cyclase/phosphodiesterase [Massilia sp. LC238]KFC74721.1 Diguanylate cyclase/phosphodiesterase [Massilia sp. LC238]